MIGRARKYDGSPPTTISAAMIREAFNLPDDAVLFSSQDDNTVLPVVITTLTVGERMTPIKSNVPG